MSFLDFVSTPSVFFCFVLIQEFVNNAQVSDHIVSDFWCRLPCIFFFFFAEFSLTRFNLPCAIASFRNFKVDMTPLGAIKS